MNFRASRDISVIVVTLLILLSALPTFLSDDERKVLPSWYADTRMTYGLDLQGGIHILLKFDREDLLKNYRDQLQSEVLTATRAARIGRKNLVSSGQAIKIQIRNPEQAELTRRTLKPLLQADTDIFGNQSEAREYVRELADGWFEVGLTEAGLKAYLQDASERAAEIIRDRIDALGTTEPLVQLEGDDGIAVAVPGFFDQERLLSIIGTTARLEFRMVDPSASVERAINSGPPPGSDLLMEYRADGSESDRYYVVKRKVDITGEEVADASGAISPETGRPVVNFRLNAKGSTKFSKITARNVGRQFAIVLDGRVVSAPVIQGQIPGGAGYIEGPDFTLQEVNDVAAILRSGALPAKLIIGTGSKVGASLGADSIDAGKLAAILGIILVALFMWLNYGTLGLIANAAVLINLCMIIGLLSLIGATLTLPGIAGMVLTVGMAVDANVLIIERSREEALAGNSAIKALEEGFNRALLTILDANITTLIAASVLFLLGSGPVRGFAITLSIGIITTIFTAFALTRLFTIIWVELRKPKTLFA